MDVRTGTASLGEYIRESQDGTQWKCIKNGDSSYLSGGEERNWWFDGDIPGDDPEVTALFADKESTAAEDKPKL
jgi:hypothetical protein